LDDFTRVRGLTTGDTSIQCV